MTGCSFMQGSKSKQELPSSTLVGAQPLLGGLHSIDVWSAARADKQMALCEKCAYGPSVLRLLCVRASWTTHFLTSWLIAKVCKVQAAQECLARLSDRQRATWSILYRASHGRAVLAWHSLSGCRITCPTGHLPDNFAPIPLSSAKTCYAFTT